MYIYMYIYTYIYIGSKHLGRKQNYGWMCLRGRRILQTRGIFGMSVSIYSQTHPQNTPQKTAGLPKQFITILVRTILQTRDQKGRSILRGTVFLRLTCQMACVEGLGRIHATVNDICDISTAYMHM